ncbi:MAG TPA: hypothetical protein VGN01_20550 [Acidobacteriaceae bacterium]|jgi:hypothetical protein
MKTGTVLVATLFALTSFPILAQQAPMDNPSNQPTTQPHNSPPGAQQTPGRPAADPAASPATSGEASPAATAETSPTAAAPAVEMRSVNAELVGKLDSKTAKTGDDVVVETKATAKTADGTEIPKGSKLTGHVVGVQASNAGQNSELVLQFDQAQLKGGQNLPIHTQIQSISPPGGAASPSGSDSSMGGMNRPSTAAANPAGDNGATGAPGSSGTAGGYSSPATTQGAGATSAASGGGPAAGTVVARTGAISIRATSIPGVLLANNEPGQQDPRMGQASSILLGSKKDVQLDGGTQMVLGVASTTK